jgi:hypothetical protein
VFVRCLVRARTPDGEDGSTFAVDHYEQNRVDKKSMAVRQRRYNMSLLILILVVLLLVGALPTWPYSTGWGYGPSGLLGLILIIVLVFALMGRI